MATDTSPAHCRSVAELTRARKEELMRFLVEFAGMREAWDEGDRSLFHGWDRRAREQVEAATA